MNKNHRLTTERKLLNAAGELNEAGYATGLILDYDPRDIKANRLRIKEWDYYHIVSGEGNYALSFLAADNRYMGLVNAAVMDFNTKEKFDCTETPILPMVSLHMPCTSESGDISFQSKTCDFHLDRTPEGRHLYCRYDNTFRYPSLEADVFLSQPPMDTMVIATPWTENKKAFYYNQKIPCMRASGYVKTKGRTYTFHPETDFGILDWGRGVWTYDNTWYWGIGSGLVDGKPFGYNVGYGFGDTSAATENMLFYDGKAHKLDLVDFGIPGHVMNPWHMTSNDGRFTMTFTPEYNDRTDISIGILSQHADKLFGRVSGTVVLDDGIKLNIENMLVFHECVHNKY